MANTFDDIETRVYYLMSQKTDSSTYDSTNLVKPKINSVVSQICKWNYTSVMDPKKTYVAADLRFLRTKTPVQHYRSISVTADFVVWATEITCTTTNLNATWWSVIYKGNVIHYTGKSATQITWCTNVLIAWTDNDTMRKLESVSVDTSKPFKLTLWNGFEQEVEYLDSLENKTKWSYYSIVGDDTSSDQFLDVVGIEDEYLLRFYSYDKSTDMTAGIDECTLPENYGIDVVAAIVAWELLRGKEQYEQAKALLAMWYTALQDMYSFYVDQIKKNQTTIERIKPSF